MAKSTKPLHSRDCVENAPALNARKVAALVRSVPGWNVENNGLCRTFSFADYPQTLGFTISVALVAQTQNHHPDMELGYNRVTVRFTTHSAGGLTENDFICAARVNQLTP